MSGGDGQGSGKDSNTAANYILQGCCRRERLEGTPNNLGFVFVISFFAQIACKIIAYMGFIAFYIF